MIRVLLLTGTVGVGKTSVLLEIGEELALAGSPYALVDLDWLAWLRPSAGSGATVQGVLTENLGLVASTFRRAGVERLPALIAKRLEVRDSGAQLAGHLAEAESFATEAEAARIGDVVLSTDDGSVAAIALEVLVSAGWAASR